MYSWFGHSEVLSASCAARAMLLRAMEEGIIGTEGLRDSIKGDLTKCVKDLHEVFFDTESGLVRPYSGIEGKPLWSLWVSKNLGSMINALNGNENLKEEFGDTVAKARVIAGRINEELKERRCQRQVIVDGRKCIKPLNPTEFCDHLEAFILFRGERKMR